MSAETINLLLVEHNPGDATLLRLALCKAGGAYTVTHAEDLGSALSLLASTRFDGILLDLSAGRSGIGNGFPAR